MLPEKGKFSHFINSDVFTRATGKQRIILQCFEYMLLQYATRENVPHMKQSIK